MKTTDKVRLVIIFIIIIFIAVALNNKASAQISFNDTQSTTISVLVDPKASIDEKGLNIGAEVNYTQDWGYIHTGFTSFSKLPGGYFDWTTAGGAVLKLDRFGNIQAYSGLRLGFIKRGKESPYATYGAESGIDVTLGKLVLGVRATEDYRGDFTYYGAPGKWILSGYVKVGIKIN